MYSGARRACLAAPHRVSITDRPFKNGLSPLHGSHPRYTLHIQPRARQNLFPSHWMHFYCEAQHHLAFHFILTICVSWHRCDRRIHACALSAATPEEASALVFFREWWRHSSGNENEQEPVDIPGINMFGVDAPGQQPQPAAQRESPQSCVCTHAACISNLCHMHMFTANTATPSATWLEPASNGHVFSPSPASFGQTASFPEVFCRYPRTRDTRPCRGQKKY